MVENTLQDAEVRPPPAIAEPPAAAVADKPAPWWIRAVALSIDVLPGAAVAAAAGLVALAVPVAGRWWWVCISIAGAAVLLTAANRVLLPAITGWSLGRTAFGIAVLRPDGRAAGPVRLLLRELAHLLDTAALFVGWLWPLWDQRGRTFADMLARTEVRHSRLMRLPRNPPARIATVSLMAALSCLAVAALGFSVAYLQDRETDSARAQVAAQGPKIVEQMLSYDPESLADDFARARSLATEHYREQLVPQQEAVQQAKPAANAYWVINTSVLSATPDRVTTLMFMQGQRGNLGQQRFITATVRVAFVKVAGSWRVDDLTVVTKPLPVEDGN